MLFFQPPPSGPLSVRLVSPRRCLNETSNEAEEPRPRSGVVVAEERRSGAPGVQPGVRIGARLLVVPNGDGHCGFDSALPL